jgi:prophage regulatory protein
MQERRPKKKRKPRPAVPHVPGLNQIIRKPDLPGYVGLQRSSIDNAIEAGTFPKPIPLGNRSVGWLATELAEWQRQRIAERDQNTADRSGLAGRAAEHLRRRNVKRVSLGHE